MLKLSYNLTIYLFGLIRQQPDIGKIYLYAKDPCEAKYEFLIKKRESADSKYLNAFKTYWIIKWYGWYSKKNWRIQAK